MPLVLLLYQGSLGWDLDSRLKEKQTREKAKKVISGLIVNLFQP